LASLKREVKSAQDAGKLNDSAVRDLAHAVASREIRSAKGPDAAVAFRSLRSCAPQLTRVLEDRAERGDDAAAEATLILFELGKRNSRKLVSQYRDNAAGSWRAVAARAAVSPADAMFRREFMRDADERVRRAALSAALAAPLPDDTEALFEAARLDPDPLSRSIAIRAFGALGGTDNVNRLDDLWAKADETTRVTLIDAWAMPAAARAGGEGKLLRIAETERGIPALSAAATLARGTGNAAHVGQAVLTRAVQQGTQDERRLAIRMLPLDDPDARKAVEKAAKDEDKDVQVMAWARLAGFSDTRATAVRQLATLATPDDDIALQARVALAAAGEKSVLPQLTPLLTAKTARARLVAAEGLLSLGEGRRAATALADDDPWVRMRIACVILGR
jgi:HEAT repeat protein